MEGLELVASDFDYVAEGSAHVVLAYNGADERLRGKVLRVSLESAEDSGETEQQFVSSVVEPILGADYVDAGTFLPCTGEFLSELALQIDDKRTPGKWRHEIDKNRRFVNVMRNFSMSLGPGSWCVEVKPKSSVLARSKLIPLDQKIKFSVPIFSMQHDASSVGDYTPALFLSGDEQSVRTALQGLWSKQHKWLRIYRDGSDVTASLRSQPEEVDKLLDRAARAIATNPTCTNRIKAMQELDYMDSTGANITAELLNTRLKDGEKTLPDLLWDRYMSFDADAALPRSLVAYSTAEEAARLHTDGTAEETRAKLAKLETSDLVGMLAEYIVSTIAKDLSIMICMKDVGDGVWESEIGVVDVGPKGVQKTQYWLERDMAAVAKYAAGGNC